MINISDKSEMVKGNAIAQQDEIGHGRSIGMGKQTSKKVET